MNTLRALAALLLITVGLSACTPYVNIPGQKGDTLATHNPNSKTIQEAVVAALQAVITYRPVEGPYQVILPQGTDPATYAKLLPQLGDQAMWSSDGVRQNMPVYEVKGIRIRGYEGEVDIVRPAVGLPDGRTEQLVTVDLKYYITGGWSHVRLRVWKAPVEDAMRINATPSAQTTIHEGESQSVYPQELGTPMPNPQ
ncbi:MAG: hypothetical protein CMJ19_09195 [Phycisphaeraceae bacterium]|nr:hypothetical protein [Phycisphaeraceae bacterium]